MNRQGPDEGTQYRSVIFYANDEQKQTALSYIDQLGKAGVFPGPIVTQVVPFKSFYAAEESIRTTWHSTPIIPILCSTTCPNCVHSRRNSLAFTSPSLSFRVSCS